ncbi:MAG TPA: hypothetical protein VNI01_07400, partial [Elusimicrobiota bacterium]|nr:hypothetical protein [Elusimicrobiota bacterium]
AEDYLLAGRALTLPDFVATLVPSFYGGTLGVGESVYRFGVANWLMQGAPYYVFALLYAAFLAGRVRVAPGMTLPDHLERACGRPAAVLGGFLLFLLTNPASEALMLGTLGRWVTGWPLPACLALTLAGCLAFLFRGGLRSDVAANRLHFVLMFAGFACVLPFAWRAAGSPLSLGARLPAELLRPLGGQSPLYVLSWTFIALWTFVDPSFHQRVSAARDARVARAGIAVSVFFWFVFDAMTTTAGLYARALEPALTQPLEAYPRLAAAVLPGAARGLFLAGVAASTAAALASHSFLSAISLARDTLGRVLGAGERAEKWVGAGLVASALLSFAMALALPSVVALWYVLGSTIIPGLLLPTLSCYFEPLRLKPRWTLAVSLAGWLGATAAWAAGKEFPFYPGLAASVAVWVLGKLLKRTPRGATVVANTSAA